MRVFRQAKRYLLLPIILLAGVAQLQAQTNIAGVEYYIDTDPGYGNATPLGITAIPDISNFSFTVPIAGLSSGVHQFFIRSVDAHGTWSMNKSYLFMKDFGTSAPDPAPTNITRIEYYIDADPGYDNATALAITPGTDISGFNFTVPITTLASGVHQLFIRSRNANGAWSMNKSYLFMKDFGTSAPDPSPSNITRVEYFLDTDPGYGNATGLAITPGADISGFNFTVPITTLSSGVHQFFIRSLNANGAWSMNKSYLFMKDFGTSAPDPAPSNITTVEYFIDADPGYGNAMALAITPGTDVGNFNFTIPTTGLASGVHQLFVRSLNANGAWSMNKSYLFTKDFGNIPDPAPANIVGIEYFIDNVTAEGTGKKFPVTAAMNIASCAGVVYFIDSLVPPGAHKVWFRSVDAKGTWSMLKSFDVNSTNMYNQQISLGNDITVYTCPGTPVDIDNLYDGVIPANGIKSWDFATPAAAAAGIHRLVVGIGNGRTDTAYVTVSNNPVPALGSDVTTYVYEGGTVDLNTVIITSPYSSVTWTAPIPSAAPKGTYRVVAANASGCVDTAFVTVSSPAAIVPPVSAAAYNANVEFTAPDGWTHYYYDNGTASDISDDILLLSLEKRGNAIGTVGVGGFMVTTAATAGVGGNTGVTVTNPLIASGSNFHAMHRFWNVVPSQQPTSPVGVRFYYNSQDLADVSGGSGAVDHTDLTFYKVLDGNPDPGSNLSGATYITRMISATNTDTVKWVYTSLGGGKHQSEFLVKHFSGGGAGFSSPSPLSMVITSFSAMINGDDALLKWQTAFETGTGSFEIERSSDGKTFTRIGTVAAKDAAGEYDYQDKGAAGNGRSLYYRLKILGDGGTFKYSQVCRLTFELRNKIIAMPNPATSFITLTMRDEFETGAMVQILDMNGKLITTHSLPQSRSYTLDVSKISAGVYQLVIYSNGATCYKETLLIRG